MTQLALLVAVGVVQAWLVMITLATMLSALVLPEAGDGSIPKRIAVALLVGLSAVAVLFVAIRFWSIPRLVLVVVGGASVFVIGGLSAARVGWNLAARASRRRGAKAIALTGVCSCAATAAGAQVWLPSLLLVPLVLGTALAAFLLLAERKSTAASAGTVALVVGVVMQSTVAGSADAPWLAARLASSAALLAVTVRAGWSGIRAPNNLTWGRDS